MYWNSRYISIDITWNIILLSVFEINLVYITDRLDKQNLCEMNMSQRNCIDIKEYQSTLSIYLHKRKVKHLKVAFF